MERSTWKWIAIAAAIVAGIVLLITLLMISRIRVAVACIKVASQAVGAMPSILLFPLLPFILEVGVIVWGSEGMGWGVKGCSVLGTCFRGERVHAMAGHMLTVVSPAFLCRHFFRWACSSTGSRSQPCSTQPAT